MAGVPRPLARGLIVSCQAEGDSPFAAPRFIAAFAKAAELGGAAGVRIAGLDNVRAVRAAVALPIIGLTKGRYPDGSVLITPTVEEAAAIEAAGADIVAVDATARQRPDGLAGEEVVRRLSQRLRAPVLADVSSFEEGLAAARAGAAYVATTLSGYTPATASSSSGAPDLRLVSQLAQALQDKVIAEGRISTPEQAAEALRLGAFAVVVGTAITGPIDIVRRFVRSVKAASGGSGHR